MFRLTHTQGHTKVLANTPLLVITFWFMVKG